MAARTGGPVRALSTEDFLVGLDADGAPRDQAGAGAMPRRLRREISVGLRGSARDRFKVVEDGMVLYGAVPTARWLGCVARTL